MAWAGSSVNSNARPGAGLTRKGNDMGQKTQIVREEETTYCEKKRRRCEEFTPREDVKRKMVCHYRNRAMVTPFNRQM